MSRDETANNIKIRQKKGKSHFLGVLAQPIGISSMPGWPVHIFCVSHDSVSIASPFLHLFYVIFEGKSHMKIRTENQLRIQL